MNKVAFQTIRHFRQYSILDNLSFRTIWHFWQLCHFGQFAILDNYVISDSLSFCTICHFGQLGIFDNLSFWTICHFEQSGISDNLAFWTIRHFWTICHFGQFVILDNGILDSSMFEAIRRIFNSTKTGCPEWAAIFLKFQKCELDLKSNFMGECCKPFRAIKLVCLS